MVAAGARPSSALITRLSGDVMVGGAGAARVGDIIPANGTVHTAAGAFVELTYFEGSSVLVEGGRVFAVSSFDRDGVSLRGAVDRIWSAVAKLLTGTNRYDTRVRTSTASVRG